MKIDNDTRVIVYKLVKKYAQYKRNPRTQLQSSIVNSIETAKKSVGKNFSNESERETFQDKIILSCEDSREYNYEKFDGLIPISKSGFYREKRSFVYEIIIYLGL